MKPEEAKKIAEAIAIALVKRPQGFSIESIKEQCVEILTTDPAAPVEKAYPRVYYREAIDNPLKIVDSQAQKIAELKADKNGLEIALAIEAADSEKLRQKIAEQEQEIERLKERMAGLHAHTDEFQAVKLTKNKQQTAKK